MARLKQLFTDHPASVGESYVQHLCCAWYFAWQMSLGALNCLVHGLLPFLFERSGSARIEHLHDRMVVNRSRKPADRFAAQHDLAAVGDNDEFHAGSTFAGTPAGCAAGIKTLELYERLNLVENAARLGEIAADIISTWERFDIVKQVRSNGLLIGVSFDRPENDPEAKDWWISRAVRSRMLANGVWALSDREETVRMYPALNMDEAVLREGLEVMEEAIKHVDEHGHTEGDSPAWPTGVAGF